MTCKPYICLAFMLGLAGEYLGAAPATKPATANGRLHLTFTERSPFSTFEKLTQRGAFKTMIGTADSRGKSLESLRQDWQLASTYELANESFEGLVPRAYKADGSWGLFVWISGTEGESRLPAEWYELFARHKLILITPHDSGNDRFRTIRAGLALDAAHNIQQRFHVDPARIYVSGFSAGADVAADLLFAFPEVFRGAYCLMGLSTFYDGCQQGDGENTRFEAGAVGPRWEGPLDDIKKDWKLVLMSGKLEMGNGRGAMKSICDAFTLDGYQRVTCIEVPNIGHTHPNARYFANGLAALDAKPKAPPTTSPSKDESPLPTQIAQARRFYISGRFRFDAYHENKSEAWRAAALQYLQRVVDDFPTAPSAGPARELLKNLNQPTTKSAHQ